MGSHNTGYDVLPEEGRPSIEYKIQQLRNFLKTRHLGLVLFSGTASHDTMRVSFLADILHPYTMWTVMEIPHYSLRGACMSEYIAEMAGIACLKAIELVPLAVPLTVQLLDTSMLYHDVL